jgi:hypothetical protein
LPIDELPDKQTFTVHALKVPKYMGTMFHTYSESPSNLHLDSRTFIETSDENYMGELDDEFFEFLNNSEFLKMRSEPDLNGYFL